MKQSAEPADTSTSPLSDAYQQDQAARATRTITGQLYRHRRGRSVTFRAEPPAPPPEPVRRPARVAQMVALAHRLDTAIERGKHKSQAAMARSAGLTRARITQLLALLSLAPDIQEELLSLEAVDGAEPLGERALRPITLAETWAEQRVMWRQMRNTVSARGAGSDAHHEPAASHAWAISVSLQPSERANLIVRGIDA